MIVKLGNKDWTDVGLYAIKIATGKSKLLCHYSLEMCKCPAIDNAILLKDDKVYFDNIISKANKADEPINLYCYDLATDALTVALPDSENPLEYHNTVLAVRQNDLGEFRNWTALDGSVQFKTDERLGQISSCDQNIFALVNKNTDDEKGSQHGQFWIWKHQQILWRRRFPLIVWPSIRPLFAGKITHRPRRICICRLRKYSLRFGEIPPAENSFLLDRGGKGGLLMNMKPQDGKYSTTYYAFTMK